MRSYTTRKQVIFVKCRNQMKSLFYWKLIPSIKLPLCAWSFNLNLPVAAAILSGKEKSEVTAGDTQFILDIYLKLSFSSD